MKLLAIDYGNKRIGLAIGDTDDNAVVPYCMIENKGRNFVFDELKKICKDEDVERIIIGMPVHMDMESEQAKLTEEFIWFIKEKIVIDVIVYDEIFTSKIAEQDARYEDLMKDRKKGWKDMVAATEILRSYMEQNK